MTIIITSENSCVLLGSDPDAHNTGVATPGKAFVFKFYPPYSFPMAVTLRIVQAAWYISAIDLNRSEFNFLSLHYFVHLLVVLDLRK